jgi:hypothetical protein
MKYQFPQFISQFNLNKSISFEDFSKQLAVLNGSDTSGKFVVRSDLDAFIDKNATKDDRKQRLTLYKQNLYKILVENPEQALENWFDRHVAVQDPVKSYFVLPKADILSDNVFAGRTHSKYGRICKNINFDDFFNTKKLYANDFEYTFGLMKAMFEDFKIRNSLAAPAFFDHICKFDGDYGQFWTDFMMGCNRASIFNPITYREILKNLFKGETLFAPVMGWNSYQIAFYNSDFKNFISTDVIPGVVNNGHKLHQEYEDYKNSSIVLAEDKTIDLYLCPSEELEQRHDFVNRYQNSVDAVLFSPPYFDLEIYPGEEQSYANYPDYRTWLEKYWRQTVILCEKVMRPGAKFGFVISNYRNKQQEDVTISQDMKEIAAEHLNFEQHYKIQWSAIAGSRQAKKTRDGNFEDLWLFNK